MCKECHDRIGHITKEKEPDEALRSQYFCVHLGERSEEEWRAEYAQLFRASREKLVSNGYKAFM